LSKAYCALLCAGRKKMMMKNCNTIYGHYSKDISITFPRFLFLFCIFLLPRLAFANFGDCSDSNYRARFSDDERRSVEFDCVEIFRVPVTTTAGTRHIRILYNPTSAFGDDRRRFEFERGVREAARALGEIGPIQFEDTTLLLADDRPPQEPGPGPYYLPPQRVSSARTDEQIVNSECTIRLYLAGPGNSREHAAFTVAHEIFHCVLLANLRPEQLGHRADWWMEGSAEWFAAIAVPDASALPSRIGNFDTHSETTPLYHMSYEAVVFFLWLDQTHGRTSILPFLRQMADQPGDQAQIAAMRAALPASEWVRFAHTYLNGAIFDPHPEGNRVAFIHTPGRDLVWTGTRRQGYAMEPFVLHRGWLEFECGQWRSSVHPRFPDHYGIQIQTGEAWEDLPITFHTDPGSSRRFRIGGMNATASTVTLAIDATQEAECQGCGDVRELDNCVVGTWRQTSNDTAEVMNELFGSQMRITRAVATNVIFKFNADGTYITAPAQVEGTMISQSEYGPRQADSKGAFQATGRWSAQAGVLTMCPDVESGDLKVTMDGHPFQVPIGKEVTEQVQRKAREWVEKLMRTRPTGKDLEAAGREWGQLQSEALDTMQDRKKINQEFRYICEQNVSLKTKITPRGWSKPITAVLLPTADVLGPLEESTRASTREVAGKTTDEESSGFCGRLCIVAPTEGAKVSEWLIVQGTVDGPNANIWLIVHSVGTSEYWVQPRASVQPGTWRARAHIGPSVSQDQEFEILAVLNPEADLREGASLNGWPNAESKSQVIKVSRE
jgi:hypothetical protein